MATYTIGSCAHRLWSAHVTSESAVFCVEDGGTVILTYLIPIECFRQMTDPEVIVALKQAVRDYLDMGASVTADAISARCARLAGQTFEVA